MTAAPNGTPGNPGEALLPGEQEAFLAVTDAVFEETYWAGCYTFID